MRQQRKAMQPPQHILARMALVPLLAVQSTRVRPTNRRVRTRTHGGVGGVEPPRGLFDKMLRPIAQLRAPPAPEPDADSCNRQRERCALQTTSDAISELGSWCSGQSRQIQANTVPHRHQHCLGRRPELSSPHKPGFIWGTPVQASSPTTTRSSVWSAPSFSSRMTNGPFSAPDTLLWKPSAR